MFMNEEVSSNKTGAILFLCGHAARNSCKLKKTKTRQARVPEAELHSKPLHPCIPLNQRQKL